MLAFASPARANWTALPGAVQVSSAPAYARVATSPDGLGGMFVVWRDSLGAGVNSPIRAQRVASDGSLPSWSVSLANNKDTEIAGTPFDACSDNAGGVYVAYADYESYLFGFQGWRVRVTRLDATGATMSGFPVVLNNDNASASPAIGPVPGGGAIVTWLTPGNVCGSDPGYTLMAQRVDGAGNRLWTDGGVTVSYNGDINFVSTAGLTPRQPAVSGGSVFLAWAGIGACVAPHVNVLPLALATGQPLTPVPGQLYTSPSTAVPYALATPTDSGDALVVYYEPRGPLTVQRYHSWGASAWGVTLSSYCTVAAAIPDGMGGVWVCWNTLADGFWIQDVSGSGALLLPAGSTDLGTNVGSGMQPDTNEPSLATDGKGGVFIGSPVLAGYPVQLRCQGVSGSGAFAFPTNGLQVSPSTQSVLPIAACAGRLNNALFAWGNSAGIWAQQVTLSNLDATAVPPNPPYAWSGPLVPRANPYATLASVAPTDLTEGARTYVNWAVTQDGPNPTAAFTEWVVQDGTLPVASHRTPDGTPPGPDLQVNVGPFAVPGGPHTLTLYSNPAFVPGAAIDAATPAADDAYSQQWIWEPAWILAGPQLNAPALDPGPYAIPNGTGHKFLVQGSPTGAPGAWVASTAARRGPTYDPGTGALTGYGDSFGLQFYDVPVGAGEYTHLVGASHQSFNRTNFALALLPALPESVYTLTVRDSAQDANPDSAWFDLEFAGARSGPAAGSQWLDQPMAAGELADVFLLGASARQPMRLALRRYGSAPGQSHLAFELFAPGTGAVASHGAGVASQFVTAAIETLTYVAPTSGTYLVAVYRADGTAAGTPVAYDFTSSGTATLSVPGVPGPLELAFAGAAPNPARGGTDFEFTLPAAGPAVLDLFDVNGRRVRRVASGERAAGEHHVRWDGKAEDGSAACAGLYFARLQAGARTLVRRFTVIE